MNNTAITEWNLTNQQCRQFIEDWHATTLALAAHLRDMPITTAYVLGGSITSQNSRVRTLLAGRAARKLDRPVQADCVTVREVEYVRNDWFVIQADAILVLTGCLRSDGACADFGYIHQAGRLRYAIRLAERSQVPIFPIDVVIPGFVS